MNAYRKLCTEFYDIDKPGPPLAALEFYARHAERAAGPILEPMCGSGRFLVALRQRGFDIDGVDASPEMLSACRDKFARHGINAALYEQSIEQMELPRRYRLVMIPAGSFSLITDADQVRRALQRIRAAMLPGAKFVLEIQLFKPQPSSAWPWGGRWIQRDDGARIVISWLGHLDAERRVSRGIHKYELIKDGRLLATEFEELDSRLYEQEEFRELLKGEGFGEINFLEEKEGDVVVECVKV